MARRFELGAAVVLRGARAGDAPRLAAVVGGPREDGSYDLDCRQQVRPEQLELFTFGQTVEYESTSMNAWIPARLLGRGPAIGTFNLDCKEAVDVRRIRLPASSAGAYAPSSGGSPSRSVPATSARELQAGEFCFYLSSSHGWIPATVLAAPRPGADSCDLDVKSAASVSSIFRLQDNTIVEYHSASSNSWIPARLLRPGSEPATFDLDCKLGVQISKIRPPPNAASAGDGSLQPKPKMRARGGASAAAEVGFFGSLFGGAATSAPSSPGGYEGGSVGASVLPTDLGNSGYGAGGGETYKPPGTILPSPAGGTTACLPPSPEDFASGPGRPGQQAPYGPPATMFQQPQSPAASLWRYSPSDGHHIDIRMEPNIDGPRSPNPLFAGDIFCVSQEFQGQQGVTFLELADGRGWVFDHKPGLGPLCERYATDENDAPGPYVVIHNRLPVTTARVSAGEGEVVAKLGAGAAVKVLEVASLPEQRLVRGRIDSPEGWMTLNDMQTGYRCAVKKPASSPNTAARGQRPACSVWG
eukprot:TRINITY_DN46283_c0_g1_i1.p1 TRINITY_DN46283_c0_g1~~TRINITY_DN46283_c0_g1_i1.p1  ORF type:complete len:537 (+),score=86.04 TRINITY_DN46283_c0_g1_i1:28-1611(+)